MLYTWALRGESFLVDHNYEEFQEVAVTFGAVVIADSDKMLIKA
jgi:hypothetical protein